MHDAAVNIAWSPPCTSLLCCNVLRCNRCLRRGGVRGWRVWSAGSQAMEVRAARKGLGVEATMKRVDTCAAEFEAGTPYMYSSYDGNCECEPTTARKVRRPATLPPSHRAPPSHVDRAVAMTGHAGTPRPGGCYRAGADFGSGTKQNRARYRVRLLLLSRVFRSEVTTVLQLCVLQNPVCAAGSRETRGCWIAHAASNGAPVLRRDAGFETIMLNCNPETVSTDYDTSSRLYFEPLTVEVRRRSTPPCRNVCSVCQHSRAGSSGSTASCTPYCNGARAHAQAQAQAQARAGSCLIPRRTC